MLESILAVLVGLMTFNNVLLFGFLGVFAILFWNENKNDDSPLHWIDMLLDKRTNRLSLTKFGQFWGIAISTWMIIMFSQQLSPEQVSTIFPWVYGTWLTFLATATTLKAFAKHKDTTDDASKDKE